MKAAYHYYWFHLVPVAVVEKFGSSLHLYHLHGCPKVGMKQEYYVHVALSYFVRVVPRAGDWQNVPMGQDVLVDSQAAGSLRDACERMIIQLDSAGTDENDSGSVDGPRTPSILASEGAAQVLSKQELLPLLQRLVRFAVRLQDGDVMLLVAHWPEREIDDSETRNNV